jgi:NSS family neurotransmitter:Na+ symporter
MAVQQQSGKRAHWGSKLGFILAAAGSAVGLGNIWKFPYVTGENGGGLFVLICIACVFLVGVPIMAAEILIGRRGQGSPITAYENLRGAKTLWKLLGWMGVVAGFIILSYYVVVAGWTLDYLLKSVTGAFWAVETDAIPPMFDALYGSAALNVGWMLVFMAFTIGVVIGGVQAGIERWNGVLMPALFLMLIGLLIYAMTLDGFGEAMRFVFYPDLSRFKGTSSVLAAVGQAFFSLSLGMGAMLTYGSYLKSDADILRSAAIISFLDIVVALMAASILFPVIFTFDFEPSAGPGLVFKTLPVIFAQLPGGRIISVVFFLLLIFAAVTSSVSLLEVVGSTVMERLGWKRRPAVLASGLVIAIFGLLSALSGSTLSSVKLLGDRGIFDSFDFLAAECMLPLGGIGIAVFAGWVLQKRETREEFEAGAKTPQLFPFWRVLVQFVAPAAVALVFVQTILSLFSGAEVVH